MEARKCPKCESSFVNCYHADVGGVEYFDEYVLHCKTCGYIERSSESGGSPVGDNWSTFCPYCGVDCHTHICMPPKLSGFGNEYKPDYTPLFFFEINSKELCIATRLGKVFVVVYGYNGPEVEIDVLAPHDNDSEGAHYQTWDSSSLRISIEPLPEGVKVIFYISERNGYWYYGSLDLYITPPVTTSTKKFIIKCDGANLPVVSKA